MENRRPVMLAGFAQRRARLLIHSGALLVSAVASFIIAAPAAVTPAGYALAAFLLFLLGVSMVMLALVADRFPGAARVAAAIASALNRYLSGGGGD